MNRQEMQDWLFDLTSGEELDDGPVRVRTFEEVGVLTKDKGLVITAPSGEKFSITISKF